MGRFTSKGTPQHTLLNGQVNSLQRAWLYGRGDLVARVWIVGIALALLLGLHLAPAIAQSPLAPPPTARVVLDGVAIFPINGFGTITAQERANSINRQLQEAIATAQPIDVEVAQRDGQPTILLNDRHLLTVTQRDTGAGNTRTEQAERWAQQLQEAITQAQEQRSPAYFRQSLLGAIALLLVAVVLSWLLGWARQRLHQFIQRRMPAQGERPERDTETGLESYSSLILLIARSGLWLVTGLHMANLFPLTRQWSYRLTSVLLSTLTSPLVTLDGNGYSLANLLVLGSLLFGLIVMARIATNFLRCRVLQATGMNRGSQEAIAVLAKYTLITLGSLVLLQLWGVNISSLAILASALGIGIGFGLQDIAKNFVSGLVLVFERPVQVGDFINVGELQGTVERIGARSTEIRTLDQVFIIVPNSRFLQQEVVNWSHRNPVSRLHIPVGVSYEADPEDVRRVLLDVGDRHPQVLHTPPPHVLFKGFGDSVLNFELLVWVREPQRQFLIKSELYFQLFKALHEHRIEIPFPQRDVHVRSAQLQLSPDLERALSHLVKMPPEGLRRGNGDTSRWG